MGCGAAAHGRDTVSMDPYARSDPPVESLRTQFDDITHDDDDDDDTKHKRERPWPARWQTRRAAAIHMPTSRAVVGAVD